MTDWCNEETIIADIGIVANTTTATLCPWSSYKTIIELSEVGQEYI